VEVVLVCGDQALAAFQVEGQVLEVALHAAAGDVAVVVEVVDTADGKDQVEVHLW
jgi:hypothetical protein